MATMMMAKEISLLLFLLCCRHLPVVDAEGFTFPTNDDNVFIVGDVVNVTWDVSTPRLSLYEACNEVLELEHNVTNKYFYLWTANRGIYRESGCVFLLQPRAANGIPSPPNITSPLFGVNKRYSDDPPPTTYNAPAATTSSAATSATTTRSSSQLMVEMKREPCARSWELKCASLTLSRLLNLPDAYIDFTKSKDVPSDVRAASPDGLGPHAVLVLAATEKPFQQAASYVQSRGSIVAIGMPSGAFLRAPVIDIVIRMISIRGSYVGNRLDALEAIDFFKRGLIKVPFQTAPLKELGHVYELMEQQKIAGRYVLEIPE